MEDIQDTRRRMAGRDTSRRELDTMKEAGRGIGHQEGVAKSAQLALIGT